MVAGSGVTSLTRRGPRWRRRDHRPGEYHARNDRISCPPTARHTHPDPFDRPHRPRSTMRANRKPLVTKTPEVSLHRARPLSPHDDWGWESRSHVKRDYERFVDPNDLSTSRESSRIRTRRCDQTYQSEATGGRRDRRHHVVNGLRRACSDDEHRQVTSKAPERMRGGGGPRHLHMTGRARRSVWFRTPTCGRHRIRRHGQQQRDLPSRDQSRQGSTYVGFTCNMDPHGTTNYVVEKGWTYSAEATMFGRTENGAAPSGGGTSGVGRASDHWLGWCRRARRGVIELLGVRARQV